MSVSLVSAQSVSPQKASYEVGEDIVVDFSGGPGNAKDWIGIYTKGETPDGDPASLEWLYTNGTQSSGGSLTSGSVTFSNSGLAEGTYSVWFLENDGYNVIAGPTDLVISPPPPQVPTWIVSQFRRRHAVSGTAYTGKISAYASSDTTTFTRVSGPEWLNISASGDLTGTPTTSDVGKNTWTIRASNSEGSADATMTIRVFAPGTESVTELKVMSFNLWHGFGQVNDGFRKGLEAIIISDADIIGTQETVENITTGNYQVQELAQALGWYYGPNASGDSGILSRYPITSNSDVGVARRITVRVTANPLREVIHYNAHLDYQYYGPYEAQKSGATAQKVLTEELKSQRDEEIATIMSGMEDDLNNADQTPVFLTGDFNTPSHLDWTPAMASHHGGVSGVAWPVSTAVHDAGMFDSFRDVHPDPVTHPGFSWSPLFVGDPQDRIDFIYYKGAGFTPIASEHFHTAIEETLGTWGGITEEAKKNTWPSDHGAMITTFKLASVDSDDDGLSDAFENEHFGNVTSQTGSGDADGDGLNNQLEQLLGSSPADTKQRASQTVAPPATSSDPVVVQFQLSELAYDAGLVLERSDTLKTWTPIWSYQDDPMLESSLIEAVELSAGKWGISLSDNGIDWQNEKSVFYRLRDGH
jgi:endonuclease/exonuclease/phosphatase family metal-dependent hydrolase